MKYYKLLRSYCAPFEIPVDLIMTFGYCYLVHYGASNFPMTTSAILMWIVYDSRIRPYLFRGEK